MKIGKKFINYLISGNVSEENYEIARNDMYANNLMMLRILSSIASTILLVCTILGFFVPNMNSKMVAYAIGLGISITILLVSFLSRCRKLHIVCMYVLDVMLLSVGLTLTLVNAKEQLTITLIPVALLIPLFFDTKPYKFLLVILVADLVYIVCAPIVKPADILALDMVDVLVFSFAGVFIGIALTKVKIERYVYAHEISRIALQDGMTKCLNQTAYNKYIEDNSQNHPNKLVAIMIDVNGLKKTNDTKGHKAGDELIVTVAQKMQFVFGAYGDCYRLGGDEFVAFVKAGSEDVAALIDSFRVMLKENKGVLVDEITTAVGFAVGNNNQTFEDLVNEADRNMYIDKSEFYAKSQANNIANKS